MSSVFWNLIAFNLLPVVFATNAILVAKSLESFLNNLGKKNQQTSEVIFH